MLGRFRRVVRRMSRMPARDVGVMAGLLMVSATVVLGRFAMVFRCVLVMFGGLEMML